MKQELIEKYICRINEAVSEFPELEKVSKMIVSKTVDMINKQTPKKITKFPDWAADSIKYNTFGKEKWVLEEVIEKLQDLV